MEKKGHPLGLNAIHPVTGAAVPVYAANFVLMGYGTGAVMAVPAHDQRDWEFAGNATASPGKRQVYLSLPRRLPRVGSRPRPTSRRGSWWTRALSIGLTIGGRLRRHRRLARRAGRGEKRVNFRLRDWGVSRQRYWGCPIPVVRTPDGGMPP